MEQNPYAAPIADPTGPTAREVAGAPREWSIGGALNTGLEAVKRQPVELVGGYFLTMAIAVVAQMVPGALLPGGESLVGNALTTLLGSIVGVIVGAFVTIGQIRAAIAAARGERVELSVFFSGGDRLGTGILVNLIVGAGVWVGLIFLIIPGIIVALGWSLAMFFVADGDESTGDCLAKSWDATKGHKWRIFSFAFVAALVGILGLFALGIGLLIAIPIVAVAFAQVFLALTGRPQHSGLRSGQALSPSQR